MLYLMKMQKFNQKWWNTSFGKVDDNTAMIFTELFNPKMVQEFINSDDFKEMETIIGLSHEVYKVEKIT